MEHPAAVEFAREPGEFARSGRASTARTPSGVKPRQRERDGLVQRQHAVQFLDREEALQPDPRPDELPRRDRPRHREPLRLRPARGAATPAAPATTPAREQRRQQPVPPRQPVVPLQVDAELFASSVVEDTPADRPALLLVEPVGDRLAMIRLGPALAREPLPVGWRDAASRVPRRSRRHSDDTGSPTAGTSRDGLAVRACESISLIESRPRIIGTDWFAAVPPTSVDVPDVEPAREAVGSDAASRLRSIADHADSSLDEPDGSHVAIDAHSASEHEAGSPSAGSRRRAAVAAARPQFFGTSARVTSAIGRGGGVWSANHSARRAAGEPLTEREQPRGRDAVAFQVEQHPTEGRRPATATALPRSQRRKPAERGRTTGRGSSGRAGRRASTNRAIRRRAATP